MSDRKSKGEQAEAVDLSVLPALPPGWCWTTLEAVAAIEGGITKDQKRARTAAMREVPYLRVANVQRGYLDLTEMKTILADKEEIRALRLEPGDILFTEGGDRDKLGRGWVWNGELAECIHQNHIFRARPNRNAVEPKFVSLHGNFFGQDWFTRTGKQTTNLASINKGVLRRFPVPVAPLNEQRCIVAKVEELFTDLDAGIAALERARANLKRYRAAVLKAAVEGKLTEEWRAAHPDTEPASVLLGRILAERRRRWEQEQQAKFKAAGKAAPKGWQGKYAEPAPPDTNGLPKLPAGWCWARMEQLIVLLKNGYFQSPTAATSGHKLLRINAVRPMEVSFSEFRYLDRLEGDAKEYLVQNGDLLFTRYNGSIDLLGVVGMVRNCSEDFLHPDKLIRVKTALSQPLPSYLEMACNVGESRKHMVGRARTTAGQTGISGIDIKDMPIPLPPLAEQERIVGVVDQQLSIVTVLETQVERDLQRAARLRQSILAEAFAGRLVPQDPADEPAVALLQRLQQAKAEGDGSPDGLPGPRRRRLSSRKADAPKENGP
jgi:type I restriction enzyme S subunit